MRKILAGLLCIALLCSLLGCSSNNKDTDNVAKGRYMEETVELPDLEEGSFVNAVAYDSQERLNLFISKGKGSDTKVSTYVKTEKGFEKKELTCYDKYFKDGHYLFQVVFGQDDKWYVHLSRLYYVDKKGKEHTQDSLVGKKRTYNAAEYKKLDEIVKDMTEYGQERLFCEGKEISPNSWVAGPNGIDDKYLTVDRKMISKDGIVIYQDVMNDKLVKYDPKSKKEEDIAKGTLCLPWYVMGNNLYVGTNNNKSSKAKAKVDIYDIATLKCNSIDMDIALNTEDQCTMYVDREENIYLVNRVGIYRHKKNGTLWEQVLQSDKCSFAASGIRVLGVTTSKNDEIYISTIKDSNKKCTLYKYFYDKDAVAVPTKKLTIYSLYNNSTVKEAARRYQLKHPEIAVEFTIPDKQETDKSELIQKLNTEILAGKGADIILTDGLNQTSYEKKGVLEDLSDIVDSSQLIDCVKNGYVKDGKLYGIPIKITAPVALSEDDMKDAFSSMAKLSEYCKASKAPIFSQDEGAELLEKLLYSYGNEIMKEDGTIDKNKLEAFLEQAKSIIDKAVPQESTDTYKYEEDPCWASSVYGGDCNTALYQALDLFTGKAVLTNNASVMDICKYETMKREHKTHYTPINNSYISSGTVTINANCKMKEEAKDFMKYLFSNEMQEEDCNDGYPVTKSALEQWGSSYTHVKDFIGVYDDKGNLVTDVVDPPEEGTRKVAIDMINSLDKPVYQDAQIISMILTESEKYLTNKADTKTTANTIMQKVNRYLEEQK